MPGNGKLMFPKIIFDQGGTLFRIRTFSLTCASHDVVQQHSATLSGGVMRKTADSGRNLYARLMSVLARRRLLKGRGVGLIMHLLKMVPGWSLLARIAIPRGMDRLWQDRKLIIASGLFDSDYYLGCNSDVAARKLDPIFDYLSHGYREGRLPSADFYPHYARDNDLDAQTNPLLHHIHTSLKSLREGGFFDAADYSRTYPDVAKCGIDPLLHFLRFGRHRVRLPVTCPASARVPLVDWGRGRISAKLSTALDPLFDARWYLSQYEDVRSAGIDPLDHYINHGGYEGKDPHPLFDSAWYLERNPDVRAAGVNPLLHYLQEGADEGRNPHRFFDGQWYLAHHPAGDAAKTNPLIHYLQVGMAEGRSPHPLFDAAWYLAQGDCPEDARANPLCHYIQHGAKARRSPHPLFDARWYLSQYEDVRIAGIDPLDHYINHGGYDKKDPHPLFDSDWYFEENPDVRAAGLNPLLHYITLGAREGRNPHFIFDAAWYSARHGQIPEGANPLAHYLTHYGPIPEDINPVIHFLTIGAPPSVRQSLTRFIEAYPQTLHKILHGEHIARTLTRRNKADSFRNHYVFLYETVSPETFDAMLFREVTLYECCYGDTLYSITIQASRERLNEGEMSLYFHANGASLYILSFTIVPGQVLGLVDRQAFLISRVQGTPGRFQDIYQATKDIHEVAPQAVLMAALQGIAETIGVRNMAGISGTNQACYEARIGAVFEQAYDQFFTSLGAVPHSTGLYLLSVPFPQKPLNLIKPGHRPRTKLRRKLKSEIAHAVALSWQRL
jgi:uncharacterized protein VirK/YbjX